MYCIHLENVSLPACVGVGACALHFRGKIFGSGGGGQSRGEDQSRVRYLELNRTHASTIQ